MRSPSLKDLPRPPFGKRGFPWTEESLMLPYIMPDASFWPKISIVTPSYNQGQFLEETIRSVLLQGYTDLEYIIIDGGSTDGSVDIIRKYEHWLAYWVSEPDRGQSHAINKGWGKAAGNIMAYLNSDDTYEPGTIKTIAKYFINHPETAMVYGDCFIINSESNRIGPFYHKGFDSKKMIDDETWFIPQQAVFIKRAVLLKVGFMDENLHFKMDRDLFIRIGKVGRVRYIPTYLANFRTHPDAKSTPENRCNLWQDFIQINRKYKGSLSIKVYLRHYFGIAKQKFIVTPLMKISIGKKIIIWIQNINIKRQQRLYVKVEKAKCD